ncbi:hypothetical protein CZ787_01600 [Halomonas citrativorans]|uniref:Uncharacterized protein n=1 Tax=Halomonas citrativorans TaxID=2742612 RepID=A0A1R4HPK1_9GAMM|nr:hypothetical protein CZ787_01600 [Halomonas citrativorans]
MKGLRSNEQDLEVEHELKTEGSSSKNQLLNNSASEGVTDAVNR